MQASNREQVLVRQVDAVYCLIYSVVGNREDAEDLTTETFLRIARESDGPRRVEEIGAAVAMTGSGVLADHFRRYYGDGVLLARHTDDREDARRLGEPRWPTGQSTELVKSILDRLPVDYRRILELRFLRGSSVAATARELGLTPQHVLELQRRALAEAVAVVDRREGVLARAPSRDDVSQEAGATRTRYRPSRR